MTINKEVCEICNSGDLVVTWTDTHGVAACTRCNSPYRIFHYEGSGGERRRVDKPPELLFGDEWVDKLKAYWKEHSRKIPNGMNLPGSSYERCSSEDFEVFSWYFESKEED